MQLLVSKRFASHDLKRDCFFRRLGSGGEGPQCCMALHTHKTREKMAPRGAFHKLHIFEKTVPALTNTYNVHNAYNTLVECMNKNNNDKK